MNGREWGMRMRIKIRSFVIPLQILRHSFHMIQLLTLRLRELFTLFSTRTNLTVTEILSDLSVITITGLGGVCQQCLVRRGLLRPRPRRRRRPLIRRRRTPTGCASSAPSPPSSSRAASTRPPPPPSRLSPSSSSPSCTSWGARQGMFATA